MEGAVGELDLLQQGQHRLEVQLQILLPGSDTEPQSTCSDYMRNNARYYGM